MSVFAIVGSVELAVLIGSGLLHGVLYDGGGLTRCGGQKTRALPLSIGETFPAKPPEFPSVTKGFNRTALLNFSQGFEDYCLGEH